MVHTAALHLETEGEVEILDVSDELTREVREADVDEGLATVFVTGSTGAITTIEHEPGLVEEDMPEALDRLFPRHGEGVRYGHERRWGDGNGHSHVRASFIGPSLTVPVVDGAPELGTWQQVVFVELDNEPRDREILVHVVGDG
jgi:secondary thiamine-phosphate synthase enzyme